MKQAEREQLAERVRSMVEPSNMKLSGTKLKQGMFVVTGLQAGERRPEKQIGFCIQVRVGRGQFGSDMVFLRHPDESLTTHENQFFYAMTEEQEAIARTLFSHLPEDEDYSGGYRCCDKIHETGFIVENSASRPSRAGAGMVRMTTTDESGQKNTTITAFI
jgi:hypothetical protein